MATYYVNPDQDKQGDNEVHRSDCHLMPKSAEYVGEFSGCREAVATAKRKYPNADGCGRCSPECHRR